MTAVAKRSMWLTVEAGVLIALGVLAIVFPLFAGIAAAIFFGWMLIGVGLIGLVAAVAGREHANLLWSVASAVIAILVGVLLLQHPLATVTLVTLLAAAWLIFDGVTVILLGLDQKKRGALRWRWVVGTGVLDILLAILIFSLSGIGSAALIGVIIGISLIAAGVGLLAAHRSGISLAV